MTMQALAKALSEALVAVIREDGSSFWKLADGSHEWMTDAAREAHDGHMPNDTDYAMIGEVARSISEVLGDDQDADLSDAMFERCGQLAENTTTSERLQWVSSNLTMACYVDEAMEERGSIFPGLYESLGMGLERHYQAIWGALVMALEGAAEELEDEE